MRDNVRYRRMDATLHEVSAVLRDRTYGRSTAVSTLCILSLQHTVLYNSRYGWMDAAREFAENSVGLGLL